MQKTFLTPHFTLGELIKTKTGISNIPHENDINQLRISYRDWETDRKSTRLNSSHITRSRMPSAA